MVVREGETALRLMSTPSLPNAEINKTSLSLLLDRKILGLPGVDKRKSRWMDKDAYFIDKREFAHFHNDNEVDVRLTSAFQRNYASKTQKDPRVKFRRSHSEWVAIQYRTRSDVDFVFTIVKLAAKANRLHGRKPD